MTIPVSNFTIPYPDFQLNETIQPDEFDDNNARIVLKANELITQYNLLLTELASVTPGTSGADRISSAPISGVTGDTIYEQLAELRAQIVTLVGSGIPPQSVTYDKLTPVPVSTPTPSTIVLRDPSGRIQVDTPVSDNDATNKAYVAEAITDGIANLERVQANLVAISEITSNSIGQSGYGYDLFRGSSLNLYSQATMDSAKANILYGTTITAGANAVEIDPYTLTGTFQAGQEVTIQDQLTETKRERITISSVSGNTLNFATTVVNTYAAGALIYRSLATVDTVGKKLSFAPATENNIVRGLTNVTAPANMPADTSVAVAFSPNGNYFACAIGVSPYIVIYKKQTDGTWAKLANPATLPTASCRCVTWSPDSVYLAVASDTGSSFINIYKRTGDTFTRLANPAYLPASSSQSCDFSSDGTYLAVSSQYSGLKLTIYKRDGDVFTKLADPASLPADDVAMTALRFSPDFTYLFVVTNASTASERTYIYKRSGDTFTRLTGTPDVAPIGIALYRGISWSPDGTYVCVPQNTSPYVHIYKRTGDTFTKLANPGALPTGLPYASYWTKDGSTLILTHQTSPYITMYARSGDTFNKISDPSVLATNTVGGSDLSPDHKTIMAGYNSSPYLFTYSAEQALPLKQQDVRYNIASPAGTLDEIRSWVQHDDLTGFTASSALSIVDTAANESYSAMTESVTDLGSVKETYSEGFVATAQEKGTQRITMNRANTADNVSVTKYLSAIITP